VTWNAVAGASRYRVYRAASSSAVGDAADYVDTPLTQFTDTGLMPSTTYYYRIAIIDGDSNEGPRSSNYDYATTQSGPTISGLSAAALSESSIKVTWNAIAGATRYRVYRATSSTSAAGVAAGYADVPLTEFTDTGLMSSTAYYYRIAIIDADDIEGPQSTNYGYTTTQSGPTINGFNAAALSESSIKVTWNAIAGAARYRVYRTTGSSYSGGGSPVGYIDAPSTEFTDTGLAPSTTYYYRIAIISGNGDEGPQSNNYDYATTQSGPTISGLSVTALSESSIRVIWNAVAGATRYRVYRATSSTSAAGVAVGYADVPSTEFTDTGLAPGTTYYYRIAIINGNGDEGPQSNNYDNATTPAGPPNNLTATVNGRVITLEWDPVERASTYYVYGAFAASGPYAVIDSVSASYGTSYHVTSITQYGGVPLSGNTTYYFKVSSGTAGTQSASVSATTGP